MLPTDLKQLNETELDMLRYSFSGSAKKRRLRGIVLSAAVVAVGVGLFLAYGFGEFFLAGLTLATLAVSTMEKITYQRAMNHYESLIQKLVHRVEGLEGVPLTRPIEADTPSTERFIAIEERRGVERSSVTNAPGKRRFGGPAKEATG